MLDLKQISVGRLVPQFPATSSVLQDALRQDRSDLAAFGADDIDAR